MAGKLVADTIESAVGGRPSVAKGAFCLAWVNFNGNTGAITKAFNVSSVTKNAGGDYTLNFTNAMVDTGYVASGSSGDLGAGNALYSVQGSSSTARTTSLFRFFMVPNSGVSADAGQIMIAIHGTN